MTKLHCPVKDCRSNSDGVCTKTEVYLFYKTNIDLDCLNKEYLSEVENGA